MSKKAQKRLFSFTFRNKQKTPILQRIQLTAVQFPIVQGQRKEWDKTSKDIKLIFIVVVTSFEDPLIDNYFTDPLLLFGILFQLSKLEFQQDI